MCKFFVDDSFPFFDEDSGFHNEPMACDSVSSVCPLASLLSSYIRCVCLFSDDYFNCSDARFNPALASDFFNSLDELKSLLAVCEFAGCSWFCPVRAHAAFILRSVSDKVEVF